MMTPGPYLLLPTAGAEGLGSLRELVSQQSCWVDGRELTMQLLRQALPAAHLTPAMVRPCCKTGKQRPGSEATGVALQAVQYKAFTQHLAWPC